MFVAKSFLAYLFTYGKLPLPALGVLRLKILGPKLVPQENKIYAPQFHIDFEEDTSISGSHFTEIVQQKKDLSAEESVAAVHKTTNRILNELLNVRQSVIPGLGTFYPDDEGRYLFRMDPELLESVALCYPDLPLTFISGKSTSAAAAAAIPPKQISAVSREPRSKIGWFFPALALLASSLLLACLISCFFQNRIGLSGPFHSLTPIEASPFNPEENTLLSQPKIDETGAETLVHPEDSFTELGQDDTEMEQDGLLEEMVESDAEPGVSGEHSEGDLFTSMSMDEILKISADKRRQWSDPCVIVVGSFTSREAVNAMIHRLDELNYEIYVEKFGAFYRTGILTDCQTVKQPGFLSGIRNSLEKDAWILKY